MAKRSNFARELGRNYLLGAPVSVADQARYLRELENSHAGNSEGVFGSLTRMLDRVTDKSVGLLQASSIFSGLAFVLSSQNSGTNQVSAGDRFASLPLAGLLLMFVSAMMLISNLGMGWRDYKEGAMSTPVFNEWALSLIAGRAARFTIGLWFSAVAFALIVLHLYLNLKR